MRLRRALALAALILPAATAAAALRTTYAVRVRWKPVSDATVAGYRVWVRPLSSTTATAQNAGLPTPAADGTMSYTLSSLSVRTDYAFSVSDYRRDGTESPRSNEVTSGYAQVAALVDEDGDGLTDAQEDKNLNRVVDPGETDPLNPDTDGDGVPDGKDACQGTAKGAAVNAAGCSCAQVSCDDGNPCTTDTCSAGVCAHAPVHDGTPCSDGNLCNGTESCQAGVCRAGTPLACNDGNPCTIDGCSPTRGCVHAAIAGCIPAPGAGSPNISCAAAAGPAMTLSRLVLQRRGAAWWRLVARGTLAAVLDPGVDGIALALWGPDAAPLYAVMVPPSGFTRIGSRAVHRGDGPHPADGLLRLTLAVEDTGTAFSLTALLSASGFPAPAAVGGQPPLALAMGAGTLCARSVGLACTAPNLRAIRCQ
jgi:hypothetical protein